MQPVQVASSGGQFFQLLQVVPSGGQICNKCKCCYLMAKFETNANAALRLLDLVLNLVLGLLCLWQCFMCVLRFPDLSDVYSHRLQLRWRGVGVTASLTSPSQFVASTDKSEVAGHSKLYLRRGGTPDGQSCIMSQIWQLNISVYIFWRSGVKVTYALLTLGKAL